MADLDLRHNGAEVAEFINQLLQRINDLSPVMRQVAGVLEDSAEQSFADERSPDGAAWADLTDYTKADREAAGYWPGQKLQRRGHLASSIVSDFDETAATVGTNVVYAAIQHFGGTTSPNSMIPNKEIPARPFLGISDHDEDEILDIVRDHLANL